MHECLTTILQPFLKIRNPKKSAPYLWYGAFSMPFCAKRARPAGACVTGCPAGMLPYFNSARTWRSFSTFPSSKQYPLMPQAAAPSMFRSQSSTKKHSSGFK